ncbi:MAG: GHMP family kinase ATP-binding protein [Thermoanaerobaculia bacterium]
MNKVIVRAPARADLAGGTLDLWPIYLFHPGSRTVNVAISFYAESEVVETGGGAIEIHLSDEGYKRRYESMQELASDPKAALIFRVVEHFHLTGISITTRTDAPRGSGLGGSSALAITLVRALSELAGHPVDGDQLITLVRDLETRLLGIPAGLQDYYPPVYGGLGSIHLIPGAPVRHLIGSTTAELARHMLLHYTGVAHFSGTNNWDMYKRQIEGKKKVQRGFTMIAASATAMEKALEAGDYEAAGRALGQEWENRKALIEGISTPEIDAAIAAATGAGAWAGKVCGAGGGGCIVFLFSPEKREAIVEALGSVPGRVLDAVPVAHGMTIQRGDDAQSASSMVRPRQKNVRASESIEQLFVYGGSGDYQPWVLAEGIITLDEPRSGTHHVVTRAFLAPVAEGDAGVLWHKGRPIEAEKLDLRAVPDPERKIDRSMPAEKLQQEVVRAQESYRQFLEESERLRVFHNATFGMYSEPNETREAFLARCMEEAQRRLGTEAERLESTFRRRMDQLRERSEREDRAIENREEADRDESQPGVNVAWGQTLYNITSGKPASAVTDAPQSARDTDYQDNIAQIQKAWERELHARRDELNTKAGEIEELVIEASARNIEISRYIILWT